MFYKTDGFWLPTEIPGALMIRPVFKSGKSSVWNSVSELQTITPSVYPNPFSESFTVQGLNENSTYTISVISSASTNSKISAFGIADVASIFFPFRPYKCPSCITFGVAKSMITLYDSLKI